MAVALVGPKHRSKLGGRGPAQLSLTLAADLLGNDDEAHDVYQLLP
jgi:hypothetical protein